MIFSKVSDEFWLFFYLKCQIKPLNFNNELWIPQKYFLFQLKFDWKTIELVMKFSIAGTYKTHVDLPKDFLRHLSTFLKISFARIIFVIKKAQLAKKITQITWVIEQIQQVNSTCAASSAPKSWINLFFLLIAQKKSCKERDEILRWKENKVLIHRAAKRIFCERSYVFYWEFYSSSILQLFHCYAIFEFFLLHWIILC